MILSSLAEKSKSHNRNDQKQGQWWLSRDAPFRCPCKRNLHSNAKTLYSYKGDPLEAKVDKLEFDLTELRVEVLLIKRDTKSFQEAAKQLREEIWRRDSGTRWVIGLLAPLFIGLLGVIIGLFVLVISILLAG